MANRAERRRQMREQAKAAKVNTGGLTQMQMESAVSMSKNEIKRMEREIQKMQAGGFTGMLQRDQENFLRKVEAREQVRKIIEHNGITAQDLDDAREAGRQEGFKQAAEPIIKCCYAGIILALHDEFGFGENRCFRAIKAVDEKIIWALNHSELCDEVLEKTGLVLDLDEPFSRVTKKEKE